MSRARTYLFVCGEVLFCAVDILPQFLGLFLQIVPIAFQLAHRVLNVWLSLDVIVAHILRSIDELIDALVQRLIKPDTKKTID